MSFGTDGLDMAGWPYDPNDDFDPPWSEADHDAASLDEAIDSGRYDYDNEEDSHARP